MAQFSHLFQVFDSNQNKDKLLRFKVGSGKVMRVSVRTTLQLSQHRHVNYFWTHSSMNDFALTK